MHMTVQIEELVLSSHHKRPAEIARESMGQKASDVNESLFAWLQNGYLLGATTIEERESWVEWELLETLAQSLNWLLPSSSQKGDQSNFSKSPFAIEVLFYEGKPQQPSPVAASAGQKTSKVGAFLTTINQGLNHAVQSLTNNYQDKDQLQVPECTFMTALMNLVCLAIS